MKKTPFVISLMLAVFCQLFIGHHYVEDRLHAAYNDRHGADSVLDVASAHPLTLIENGSVHVTKHKPIPYLQSNASGENFCTEFRQPVIAEAVPTKGSTTRPLWLLHRQLLL